MRGTWQTTDGGGSGALVLVVVVALVLIGSGAASAAASAIASLLVTIAIVLGSAIVLAVLGAVAWLVYRARQDRPVLGRRDPSPSIQATPIAARPVHQLAAEPQPQLEAPGREVHLHLNVTPDQLAAIMRHYTEESS
jgi:hypothetical protein